MCLLVQGSFFNDSERSPTELRDSRRSESAVSKAQLHPLSSARRLLFDIREFQQKNR